MSEEKKDNVTQVKTRKVERAKENENSTVMYVGPTVPGKITSNTTFKNGMPKTAKEISKEYPYFERLFIPLREIADARKQLKEKNSYLTVLYNQAKEIK